MPDAPQATAPTDGSAYAPSRGTDCGSAYAASHRTDCGSAYASSHRTDCGSAYVPKPPHRLRKCLRLKPPHRLRKYLRPKPGNRVRKRLRLKAQRRVELLPWLHRKPVGRDLHSPNDQSPTIVMDQLVTITSAAIVRDGPSSSAKIIGRAYAGANARVAATDSGWAQVEDAASGNKGWVESSILEPSTTTAATDEPDVAAPDTWPEDQRAATSENRNAASKSKHSAEAKRHRAKHHHGRRRFVFRFAIRGF